MHVLSDISFIVVRDPLAKPKAMSDDTRCVALCGTSYCLKLRAKMMFNELCF